MFLLTPNREDIRILFKLAIPLILTGLVESSINFFSTFFLSRLGETSLAAGALAAWLFSTMMVIFWGTLTGISVLVSRKFGEKDDVAISHILRDSLILAVILTIPSFIFLRYLPSLFTLLGQPSSLIQLAYSYVDAMSWCILPDFIGMVLIQFLVSLGRTRTTLLFSLIWVPVNIISNGVLVFGKWGFPALGIAGIGWGTTFSFWFYTITLAIYLICHRDYRIYLRGLLERKAIAYIQELLKIGLPIGGMFCLELGFFLVLSLIMGQFGSLYIAANQLTVQFLGFLVSITFAIAGAITVRMGHMLGERNIASAQRALSVGTSFAASVAAIVAIVCWFFPLQLISIDLPNAKNAPIFHIAKDFLFFAGFFQFAESIRITFYGGLRALKDTSYTFATSIVSFWLIPLPLGWFLVNACHWQPYAYWLGMIIGSSSGALLLAIRLRKKMRLA